MYKEMIWGRDVVQVVRRRPLTAETEGSIPGRAMWDFLWTKCHRDSFLSENLDLPLSALFHQSSVLVFQPSVTDAI